jgi:hypothetical protein
MIWIFALELKIKEKMKSYNEKLKGRDDEWNDFKARTSKDESKNL